jgi:hypothetical protein
MHAHALDERAPAALIGQGRDDGELKHADHDSRGHRHHQLVVAIARDGGERGGVGRRQRGRGPLAPRAEGIVGEHAHDGGELRAPRAPE